MIPSSEIRSTQTLEKPSNVASPAGNFPAATTIRPLQASELIRFDRTAGAAPPPGVPVYSNEVATITSAFDPGPNQRVADDLTLANGACNAVYYNLAVYGFNTNNLGGTYNVNTELWTGNPCNAASTAIADTAADFLNIANDDNPYLLEATIDPSVAIPATVWMAVTFSGPAAGDAAWVVALQAEIGSTTNTFSENDTDSNPDVCGLFNFRDGTPYAGFWANINCQVVTPPNGACCNGVSCSQTTQAGCAAPGVWQGAFTTCQPNICQPGACCSGADFETCADTTEAGCPDGLFQANQTCATTPCGANFSVYENTFATGIFVAIGTNEVWGDDLLLGPGAPCQLTAYELQMAGDDAVGPATFNAHVELWTNDDADTPTVFEDDIPGALIPGTAHDFNGVTADTTRQILLAGPFSGVVLPNKVWMVVRSTTTNAGPVFAGLADVGFSVDGFAIFGDHDTNPGTPNTWAPRFQFPPNGYDPTNCPGPNCVPAGSFRARMWCEGEVPTGACCNDVGGACTEGVRPDACEGRWVEAATCDLAGFDPPCGASACCFPNPLNPNSILCQDRTRASCQAVNGESSPGRFCVDVPVCPIAACVNKGGNCFSTHATGGCENAFCCDKVCAVDPSCCSTDWDSACVTRALALCSSDNCPDALPIGGSGPFSFDNTAATTDGPEHAACGVGNTQNQVSKDVWYCWTASCTEDVYVRTCGQTTVDTRLAVYEGCGCPVSDTNLLDCNDDACQANGVQSVAVFRAAAGRKYLVRLGNYPGELPGTGTLSISCGPPSQVTCPATGDCCAANGGTAGCSDDSCCERVCGCDPFCCEVEWDAGCSTTGLPGSGCGAAVLCPAICGDCPTGTVTFDAPPAMTVDARKPHTAASATPILGIDQLRVLAPPGVDNIHCWRFCETVPGSTPNGIVSVTDNGDGSSTVHLAHVTTPGSFSKVTYSGTNVTATLIAHPGNVDGDGSTNLSDVLFLMDALNGFVTLPAGLYSGDIDRSGLVTGADLLDEVGLLIGEGAFPIWNNTARPSGNVNCPTSN